MKVPTSYLRESWEELEAQHEGGFYGEREEMRALDRYEAAHHSELLSVELSEDASD